MADGRVLVLGATGLVGGAVLEEAVRRGHAGLGTYRNCIRRDLTQWTGDIAELERVVDEASPSAVVYAAGFTAVDQCEERPHEAQRWNAALPTDAARLCSGIPFVYFSTEYVFDGRSGPYYETDPVNPTSAYGRSKVAGEEGVLAVHQGALVLRTTVVYGPDAQGKSFVSQLRRRLERGERMRVPCDQVSSPTYNRDLATRALDLVERGSSGIWHVAGPGVMNRYEFARLAAKAFDLDSTLIDGVPTSELGQTAERPLHAGLRIDRLVHEFGSAASQDPEHGLADFRAREMTT